MKTKINLILTIACFLVAGLTSCEKTDSNVTTSQIEAKTRSLSLNLQNDPEFLTPTAVKLDNYQKLVYLNRRGLEFYLIYSDMHKLKTDE
ncbi:MAG: hypothetical protein ACJAZ3_000920 [Sphingobacteriales bacterium]|jgi:hypothetical protein